MTAYAARLGHVHLKVRDLDRSVAFYRTILGLRVTERVGGGYTFLSRSDAHHDLALQQIGAGAETPGAMSVGLYHTAWEVDDRPSLALAFNTLVAAGVRVDAVDHGISWALYFRDPDGNGVEIYLDRRDEENGTTHWGGQTRPLTEQDIIAV